MCRMTDRVVQAMHTQLRTRSRSDVPDSLRPWSATTRISRAPSSSTISLVILSHSCVLTVKPTVWISDKVANNIGHSLWIYTEFMIYKEESYFIMSMSNICNKSHNSYRSWIYRKISCTVFFRRLTAGNCLLCVQVTARCDWQVC